MAAAPRDDACEVRRPPVHRFDLHALQARTLGAAYVAGGATCVVGALFPLSPAAPVRLGAVLGALCLLVGAALLAGARRLPPWVTELGLPLGVGVATLLVAHSHTLAGVVLSAFSLPWLGVWAAAFLAPRRAVLHAVGATSALAAGVAASDAPSALVAGAALALATWAATLAFAAVAVHVRAHLDTDPLTGLLNRAGLRRAAARERALAERQGRPVAVAILDLDDFKGLNDRYGHAAGDRALTALGRAWHDELRAGTLLGREGGDEFVLVAPGAGLPEAWALLERLREACNVRWTAGVTDWRRGEDLEACLERADHELYRNKRRGRQAEAA